MNLLTILQVNQQCQITCTHGIMCLVLLSSACPSHELAIRNKFRVIVIFQTGFAQYRPAKVYEVQCCIVKLAILVYTRTTQLVCLFIVGFMIK